MKKSVPGRVRPCREVGQSLTVHQLAHVIGGADVTNKVYEGGPDLGNNPRFPPR